MENERHGCRASVAMAVYNGEAYLAEQLDSVLAMMDSRDELVISYDKSDDNTWELVTRYVQQDNRICLLRNNGTNGVSGNFSNAAMYCTGEYVFFYDQDDVWINDKINKMCNAIKETGALLVIYDGYIADSKLNIQPDTLFSHFHISTSPLRNWYKGTCSGCCMAFRRELLPLLCPFPEGAPYDLFTVIICGVKGKIALLREPLIIHRTHGANTTGLRRSARQIIKDRGILAVSSFARCLKKLN